MDAHPYIFTQLSIDEEGRIYKEEKPGKIDLEVEEVKELKIESLPYKLTNSPLYRFKLCKVKGDRSAY